MNAIIGARAYDKLRTAILGEISTGLSSIKDAYQRQVVVTHWNIGRVLNENLELDPQARSADNMRVIRRLSKDFKRTESFFYTAAKFNRLYPVLPGKSLGWTHYVHLLRVDDPKARLVLEKKALKHGLAGHRLRVLISRQIKDEEEARLSGELSAKVTARGVELPCVRGRLYHYRVHTPEGPETLDGRILVDLGFGIDRDVAESKTADIKPGYIVRVLKEGEDYALRKSKYEPGRLYTYKAAVIRVVDGDTLAARMDLGFRTWVTRTIRLRGMDCPEVSCTAGIAARQYVKDRLEGCGFVIIKTYKQEKYGRFLGDIFYMKHEDDPERVLEQGTFLNQELLDEGLAVAY